MTNSTIIITKSAIATDGVIYLQNILLESNGFD